MIRWFVPIIAFEQHIDNSVNFITFKQENGCGCHLLGIQCEKQEKKPSKKKFLAFFFGTNFPSLSFMRFL